MNEEFREYQYVKDVWNIGTLESISSVRLSLTDYLNSLSVFENNFLNEITKEKSDGKHVYYWEEEAYKFALKLVITVSDDVDRVHIRWDYLLPPEKKNPNIDLTKMSYRFQSYYVMNHRSKSLTPLRKIHSQSIFHLRQSIESNLLISSQKKERLLALLKVN